MEFTPAFGGAGGGPIMAPDAVARVHFSVSFWWDRDKVVKRNPEKSLEHGSEKVYAAGKGQMWWIYFFSNISKFKMF